MDTTFDEFDRDAEETSEARVVNVTDNPVRFEIAAAAGSKPRRYKLGPYGSANASIHIEAGYTQPFKGVGRGMVRATIESLTEREAYPGGPRLPAVVHESRVDVVRAAWAAAMANKGKIPTTMVILPRVDGGDPIHAAIASPEAVAADAVARASKPAPPPPVEDVEDQSGPIDPDPDADLPALDDLPVVAADPEPTPTRAKGGRSSPTVGAR